MPSKKSESARKQASIAPSPSKKAADPLQNGHAASATKKASIAPSPSKRAADPPEEGHVAEGGTAVKRRKGLGVRVIGGRIYDSENGKTCHQCRQKTVDFMAPCKATFNSRPCTQNYCAKCLLNRYGEKVAEVAQLPSWSCPRCRGECNCSICLKKQGCVPTGILAHTAKATGFTSVADFLKIRPAVKADCVEAPVSPTQTKAQKKGCIKDPIASVKSPTSAEKQGTLSRKLVKGVDSNTKKRKLVVTADGDVQGPVANALLRTSPAKKKDPAEVLQDASSASKRKKAATDPSTSVPASHGKKEKKTPAVKGTLLEGVLHVKLNKLVTFGGVSELKPSTSSLSGKQAKSEEGEVLPIKAKKKKSENKSAVFASSVDAGDDKSLVSKSNPKASKKKLKENAQVKVEAGSEVCPDGASQLLSKKAPKKKEKNDSGKLETLKNCKLEAKELKKKKPTLSAFEEEIVLPQGEPLMMVAGLDFPSEAIGPALQLVEFCSAFNSVLGLRRGDAEAMLRELTKGRLVRKGPNSLLVQLHAKLLNMIENSLSESSGEVTQSSCGKMSWLNVLKKHLSERSCVFLGLSTEKGNTDSIQPDSAFPKDSSIILENDLRIIKDAIEGGAEGYENLGVYHKLQILVILCDDSLETLNMRDHIESVNRGYSEAQKESREEVLAARKEVRDAKQKIKDAEVAKYLALGNINGPLTPEDQEALLSKVLAETERAVAAASLEKDAVSRMKKGRSDAVRTDVVAWGPDGRAFYKLKGVDNMNSVVVQECKVEQPGLDCWRVYTNSDEDVLTKYLLQRARISRKKMLAEAGLEDAPIKGVDEEKENRIPNSAPVKVESLF
eukprot:c23209_g1_i1 orf=98-2620(+)